MSSTPKRFRQLYDDGDEYREMYNDDSGGGGRYRDDREHRDDTSATMRLTRAYDDGDGEYRTMTLGTQVRLWRLC